jgi:hypothetical protein
MFIKMMKIFQSFLKSFRPGGSPLALPRKHENGRAHGLAGVVEAGSSRLRRFSRQCEGEVHKETTAGEPAMRIQKILSAQKTLV